MVPTTNDGVIPQQHLIRELDQSNTIFSPVLDQHSVFFGKSPDGSWLACKAFRDHVVGKKKKTIYCVFKNENYTYCSKMLTLKLLGTEDSRLVSSISCSLRAKNSPCGQRTKSTDLLLSAFHTHILNLTYINTCYCTVTFTSD